MEFMIGFYHTVTKAATDADPDAEHKVIMDDLRYMIEAEKAGFKYAIVPEHHFLEEYSHISGNAPAMGYLAAKTSKIHLLSGIMNPLPQVSHPAKVAETVAYLDHLSEGRFEFGTGRGAGSYEIGAFFPEGTDTSITKDAWADVIDEFPKMWMQDIYEGYQGKFWQMPARPILPRMYKKPHPPMWYAAGNPSSFEMAGSKGLGIIGFAIQSFADAERLVPVYKKAIANANPVGAYVNDYLSASVMAFVSEDEEKTIEWATGDAMALTTSLLYRYHDTLPRPPHIPEWPEIVPNTRREDIPALREMGQLIGTPDQVIESLKKYEALGVDGIIIGVGYLGEEHAMETIEAFGKHIIPALDKDPTFRTDTFRNSANVSV